MSWTRLTHENRFYIHRARTILRGHHKTRPNLFARAVCSHCGQRWGAWGCDDTVWAIDYLNRLSDLIVTQKPAPLRPRCGRRAPKFRAKINRAQTRAHQAFQHHQHHTLTQAA